VEEGKMACGKVGTGKLQFKLDTKNQTREKIHEMLDQLLRENNAIECGLMHELMVSFEKPAEAH
jgi:hypothetical protein